MSEPKWICRWKYWIAPKPLLPGVWRKKDGGFVIRGRVNDPRTNRKREVLKSIKCTDPADALKELHLALDEIRAGTAAAAPSQSPFCVWSVSLLDRKIARGEIRSAATIEKWNLGLRDHLIPFFGALYMDQIRRADIEGWKDHVAARLTTRSGPKQAPSPPPARKNRKDGENATPRTAPKKRADATYTPVTANGWLSLLRVIVTTYVAEHELERDPMRGVTPFDTRGHRTYTNEQPNSLTVDEVGNFLTRFREKFPQHYAMTFLGFATALRPSSLRPLRHKGAESDVLWNEGVLLVRRSHTRGQQVMDLTKTGKDLRIALPEIVLDVLRWHVTDYLPEHCEEETDLLFPAADGRLRSASSLKKAFASVAKAVTPGKRISSRAMRRTFQDLARSAEMRDIVTRSISGHATASMQGRYSTVMETEQRDGIAKVVDLAGVRQQRGASGGKSGGEPEIRKGEAETATGTSGS